VQEALRTLALAAQAPEEEEEDQAVSRNYDASYARRVAEEKAIQRAQDVLLAELRAQLQNSEQRVALALSILSQLTGLPEAELREQAEDQLARESLVSAAAEASERFGDDELERFAEEQRR
jgi:hypothetical protein